MKIKKNTLLCDILWGLIILLWIAVLVVPPTRAQYLAITGKHEYLGGFFNFAILATMGDLLAGRISAGKWTVTMATFFKLLVWGFIGMAITLYFGIMANGIGAVQKAHLLPFAGSSFAHAFFTSLFTNLSFGPAMFLFHKFTDTYIDSKFKKQDTKLSAMIERIDWKTFFRFTVFTTIPIFWIPCHTIVFLLPANFRVLMAAFLSIALGLLLSVKNKVAARPGL